MKGKTVKETSATATYVLMPTDANIAGNVHGGVIMRHIDETGAIVAVRHARSNVVTASIDRLDFHNPGYIGELLIIKASINLAGRSSMEIGVRVEAENLISGEMRHIASAYLTYVALDENRRPAVIPPVILESEDEMRRNRDAIERRKLRLAEKQKENRQK